MSVDEVKAIADNDELINLSDAQAWKLEDLSAGTVKLDSTTLEAKVGTYEAVFSVKEESATKVTTTIKVIDKDVIERGDNYTIGANNIVMTVDEAKAIADNNELITLSNAEAIKQKDMSAGKVNLDSTTFKAEAGTYEAVLSVDEEPATKTTIKIKVISGHVIDHGDDYTIVASNLVMTVEEAKAISDNDELITLSKAEAVKRKDLSAGTVELDSTTFATAVGTYKATFSVKEEPATKATITIQVVEKDELEDGDDYAIGANNFTVRKGEVASLTNDKIIELAKAQGWKLSNLSNVEVAVDEKSIGTDTESTSYFVRFKVVDKPSKTVTVKVRVVEGNGPKIDFETPVNLNVGDTFDPKKDVTATDEEDGDLMDKLNIEGTVDTNTKGVYRLVYSVKDSDGNEDVKVRVVAVGLYVGEEYIFDISNYVILKDDVKGTDAEILKNTEAKAWYVKSGLQVDSSQLEVRDNGGYKAEVGDYTVKVSVKGATNEKDVVSATAKVVNGHVIEEGNEYTLVASDLVMSVDEVNALANNDELISLSKAQAWKVSDLSAADVKLDSTTLEAKVGTYEAVFSVKDESATKVTTKIQVIDKDIIERGDNYTIGANNIVMTVDEAKAIADNKELITLSDAQAIKQKDMSAGKVNLDSTTFKAEAGTYEAVLSVDEEPATKVIIQIKVINGDVIEHGDEYTIVANNLIMTVDEAKAISDNDELITLSNAQAIKRKDMSAGKVNLDSTTFKAQEGDYTAKFSVDEEPKTTATIQIKVVNGHVIEHGEKYTIVANNLVLTTEEAKTVLADKDSLITLSDAKAWERKTITEGTVNLDSTTLGITEGTYNAVFSVEEEPKTTATIQIKVVNKDELETGDDYAIGANNFSIRKGQVDTITDDELILAAKAEAWKLKDLSDADVEVQSKLIGDDTESTDYYVIFNVVDKPSKTVKVKVRITDGNAPEIDFETPLYLDLNDSFDPKENVTVWDEEDGDLIDDLEITGVVDTSKKDVYRLVYSVKDSDGNLTERVRVVVVGLYIGNEYAFDIKNYVILKDDVTGTDKEIIEKSEARAWSMKTGLPIQSSLLEVRDNGGYKAEVGEYTAKVSVIGATDAKDVISTRAKVVDGDVIGEGDNYTIVANNIVMTLDEAEAVADNNALIDLAKARAWKLEDLSEATVKLESTTFKKEIGYYTAVFCVNDDEDVKVAISIKVDEGDVIEHGDEYTIVASNIVMTVDEAKAIKSNHELIGLAKARAYKRKDMTSGTVMLEATTFKAEEGDYTATFYVGQEQTTKATVKIKVVKGDVITHGDKYTIVGSNIVMTVDEVNAMNNNDDLITLSNVQAFKRKEMTSANVKLDSTTLEAKVGDYEATFSVVDEPKTKAKVKIKVIDKDVIEHGDKYTIAANNLVMTLDEAKAIKDNSELITLAQAEAYKRKDMSAGTVQLDSTTFDAKAGEYTAVFSVEEEPTTKATIKIRVIDGDIIEHGDKYTIVASNVVMSVDEAKALTDNNGLIGVAKVEAYKRKDMSAAAVQLDSTTFTAKVGDYKATFSVVNEPTTKAEVMIKVIDKDVIEHGDKYTIVANNLVMSVDEVKALTDNKELITLADAEAFKRRDMSAGSVQLDSTTLVAEAGDYTAVFSVEEEPATKATIKIKVVNSDVIEHGDKYTIVGNNVVMTLDEARAMTDSNDLITLSNTQAFKRKDMSAANVKLDSTSFEVKVGDYEATFSVVDEPTTKATVKIKVVDGDVIEHGDEYTIVASNIVISEQDAQAVETSDDVIKLAKAQAYKRKDMSEGTVQLDETTFEAVAGDYTATFSVVEEPKTKATVKIKVVSKDVIVEGDRYFMGANNITINAQTASAITDEELIALSDAEAWLKKDLSSAEVAVQSHNVKGEAGEYEATFYVVDEPTTTCTITVTVSKTVLVISANDFNIKHEDAANLDAETSKALSNVKVDVDSRSRAAVPTVDDVVVEEAHLSEIQKAPAKGGEYDLRFSVTHENEEYEVIVKVTVNPKDAKPSIAVPAAPSKPGVSTGDTTDKTTLLALFMIALSAIIVVKRRKDEEEA
nr:immunoglobulin-like domain-containing protein [Breznakia pachnodae]